MISLLYTEVLHVNSITNTPTALTVAACSKEQGWCVLGPAEPIFCANLNLIFSVRDQIIKYVTSFSNSIIEIAIVVWKTIHILSLICFPVRRLIIFSIFIVDFKVIQWISMSISYYLYFPFAFFRLKYVQHYKYLIDPKDQCLFAS